MSFEIRAVEEVPARAILDVIETAFGSERGMAWYEWKHRDGPWGPSTGLVAVDGRDVIGVRLLLPWRFTVRGTVVAAHRAVEAATVPTALRRGVFSALNRELMDRFLLIFSTPNDSSRPGYEKLGWEVLPPIPHVLAPVRPRSDRTTMFPSAARCELMPDGNEAMQTQWTADALRWRFDDRSGNEYQVAIVDDGGAGVVYRRIKVREVPVLLLLHGWGGKHGRNQAIGSAATRERTLLTLSTPLDGRRGIRRNHSLVAVWQPSTSPEPLGAWNPGFHDLESVL